MHVLLAVDVFDPARGGAAEWVCALARWLVARDYRVTILCELAPAGCDFCEIVAAWPGHVSAWRRALHLQRQLPAIGADVVHDTGCLLDSDVFHPLMGSRLHCELRQLRALPWSRRWGHARRTHPWLIAGLQLYQMARSRLLVACSERVRRDFASLGFGVDAIIRNGITPLSPALSRPRAERLQILLTSNNHYLKGVPVMLGALCLLEPRERARVKVLVVGHNDDEAFAQLVARHGLQDCCELLGWTADIDSYYRAADVFLHPTYHDAGSLSTLKALSAGCAVVTSCMDGSADVIDDGWNGLILRRPGDPHELAQVLRRLLWGDLAERLGRAAARLAPELSQERAFAQVERLYLR